MLAQRVFGERDVVVDQRLGGDLQPRVERARQQFLGMGGIGAGTVAGQ